MTLPSPLVFCLLAAGTFDLIFALGLYLFAVRLRGKPNKTLPLSMAPTPVIAAILSVIGVLTIVAGVLMWIFKPV